MELGRRKTGKLLAAAVAFDRSGQTVERKSYQTTHAIIAASTAVVLEPGGAVALALLPIQRTRCFWEFLGWVAAAEADAPSPRPRCSACRRGSAAANWLGC